MTRPRFLRASLPLCLLATCSFAPSVLGQTAPPPAAPPQPAPTAAPPPAVHTPAPPAPPAAVAAPPTARESSRAVLRAYVAEDDAAALRLVQEALERCELASRRECPDSDKALLLRDLGIVQAGAYRDHAAAVTAFRDALHLDAKLSIPPDLLVERVRDAFVEAGGQAPATETSPAPEVTEPRAAAAATAEAAPAPPADELPSRYDPGDTFLLVVGSWGGGADMTGDFNGELGAAVSGLWHVTGPLAVGARLTAGSTLEASTLPNQVTIGTYGIMGAAGLLGIVPRGKRNTGYFLLGVGPDYAPELDRARTVVSLAGGVSFNGFTFGGMPALVFNQGRTYGAMWFFIGWGNYVKD